MNGEVRAAREAFDAKIKTLNRRAAATEGRIVQLEQSLAVANAAIRALQQANPTPTVPVVPVRQ